MPQNKMRIPIEISERENTKCFATKTTRFLPVVIDVLHTGLNRNYSIFNKDSVDKAAHTIKNTPILGYIENKFEEDMDFKGHESEMIISDDQIKYVYSGSAYGVIPESCNPRWVTKMCDDGIERDFFRVDGLMWTKFDESTEIVLRDGCKNHSMEIVDITGTTNKDGYFDIDSFVFDGCCVLSTTDPSIQPAMINSEMKLNFSADSIAAEIKSRLAEYEKAMEFTADGKSAEAQENSEKGEGVNMDETKEMTLEADVESTISEEIDNVPAEEIVEEVVVAEMTEAAEPEAEVPAEEAPAEEVVEEKPAEEFALNVFDLMNEIQVELEKIVYVDVWGYEYAKYFMIEIQGSTVIAKSVCDWNIYGIPYTMNGDHVVLDMENIKRMKCQYVDFDEGEQPGDGLMGFAAEMNERAEKNFAAYTELKAQFDEIKPKYDKYVEAEEAAAKAEIKIKRDKFIELADAVLAGDEEYEALKDNEEIELAELEDKCYAMIGKKRVSEVFSYVQAKNSKSNAKFGLDVGAPIENSSPYGDWFERYKNK